MLAAAYLAAGVAVAAWTAARGEAVLPHWNGIGKNPGIALASTVVLWPYAAFKNLTLKTATIG